MADMQTPTEAEHETTTEPGPIFELMNSGPVPDDITPHAEVLSRIVSDQVDALFGHYRMNGQDTVTLQHPEKNLILNIERTRVEAAKPKNPGDAQKPDSYVYKKVLQSPDEGSQLEFFITPDNSNEHGNRILMIESLMKENIDPQANKPAETFIPKTIEFSVP